MKQDITNILNEDEIFDLAVEIFNGEMFDLANKVFNGNMDCVKEWFNSPIMSLGNKRPFDLMFTDEGRKQVVDCLHRIEYGVYG